MRKGGVLDGRDKVERHELDREGKEGTQCLKNENFRLGVLLSKLLDKILVIQKKFLNPIEKMSFLSC